MKNNQTTEGEIAKEGKYFFWLKIKKRLNKTWNTRWKWEWVDALVGEIARKQIKVIIIQKKLKK